MTEHTSSANRERSLDSSKVLVGGTGGVGVVADVDLAGFQETADVLEKRNIISIKESQITNTRDL